MPSPLTRVLDLLPWRRAATEQRARLGYTGDPSFWNRVGPMARTPANITPDSALTVATAYACIRAISHTLATVPKAVHEVNEAGRTRQPLHPVTRLIADQPNDYQTAFEFWERMYLSALTTGRGVALIERDSFTGNPVALHHVHPRALRLLHIDGTLVVEVDGTPHQWADVLMVQELGGLSPVELHRDNLNLSKDVEGYGGEFFQEGHMLGVLSAEGHLTTDQLRDIRESWTRTEKRGVKVLPSGFRYQPISLPPEQTQFLTTRRYQDETICTIYGVPPRVVGVATNQTKANSEEEGRNFVRMALLPRAVRTEQEIARKLLSVTERTRLVAAFDLDELQRGDMQARANYLATLLDRGVYSRNEARRTEGLTRRPEPEADALLVQVNQIQLSSLGAYSEKIASNDTQQ